MKIEEKSEELFKETKNGIFLIEIEKGKLCLLVKGENIRLANMLKEAFDSRPDFFELIEMTVNAYKDLQEFKELSLDEKAEKIVEELERLYKRLHEITGTCFACCNVKIKGDKDDEGHTISCKVGRCLDLGESIATALRDEKELRECVEMFLNTSDNLEKIKKALKGFLNELDK